VQVDEKLISYLEDLSCLTLSDSEKSQIADNLEKILHAMNALSGLNTEGVNERSHPFDNTNAFREDEVQASFDRDLILKNAPEHNDEMFIVPKTVE